ncbi:MAG: tetratricopeptide repeat protein [Spirochaetaceae bacterium]|jgi:tetratricopeptide (TPR) repeat protein|nr:tetratricopeptide repeat protein [Spirochaetaceae bacterium]
METVNGDTGTNPGKTEIAEISKQGYLLLKQNKNQEARGLFLRILEVEPENNYALVGLGDSERKQGRYTEAVEFYRQCLKIYPDNNYALFGLADSYRALKMQDKAIEAWEQYLTHDSRNISVITRVADAYRKFENFEKSQEFYLKALEIEPDNSYALIGLGHLHYDFKDYEDALRYWKRMEEKTRNNVDIRVLTAIGNCYRKLKQFDKGLHYFEQALKMEDKNFYALFGMGDCYRGLNRQNKSIEYWQRILELYPQNKEILTRMGDAYRNSGALDRAVSYYERALDFGFDEYALLGLARIERAQGKVDNALARINRLIGANPQNPRFYLELADSYVKMNNPRKAKEALKNAQRAGAWNPAVGELLDKISAR